MALQQKLLGVEPDPLNPNLVATAVYTYDDVSKLIDQIIIDNQTTRNAFASAKRNDGTGPTYSGTFGGQAVGDSTIATASATGTSRPSAGVATEDYAAAHVALLLNSTGGGGSPTAAGRGYSKRRIWGNL
jgi:hypothetical protein